MYVTLKRYPFTQDTRIRCDFMLCSCTQHGITQYMEQHLTNQSSVRGRDVNGNHNTYILLSYTREVTIIIYLVYLQSIPYSGTIFIEQLLYI